MNNALVEVKDKLTDLVLDTELNSENSSDQYLSFKLANEFYCIDILKVSEIRSWQEPTLLPNAPSYLKGVINIRGNIIPIVDLRLKLGLPSSDYTKQTVVVVVSVFTIKTQKRIGMVVDSVSDVFCIDKEGVAEAPETAATIDTSFIRGLCSVEDKVVAVLDIDKILDLSDIEQFYKSLVAER